MTDRQGTTGKSGKGAERQGTGTQEWRVDGWESEVDADDRGLSDTVVRMPRIPAEGPAPTLPNPPAVHPSGPKPTSGQQPPTARPASGQPALGQPASGPQGSPMFAPYAPVAAPVGAAPTVPVPAAVPAPKAEPVKRTGLRRTRKARLRLSRIDPWSVMKTSFLFSIAFGIMSWVAVWVLWTVIIRSGLFEAINSAILNIISNPTNPETWRIEDYINTNKVLGITALLAVINVVITTALGTLAAFLYNLSANILGGLELTLAED